MKKQITPIEIINNDGTLQVDSRTIAIRLNIQHKNVMENLSKYSEQFQVLGSLTFKTETRKRKVGGTSVKYALLNEDQCVFLLTLSRNTEQVVQLKLDLTVAFKNARQSVQHAKSLAPILYTSNPWIWQSISDSVTGTQVHLKVYDCCSRWKLLTGAKYPAVATYK